MGLFDMVCTLIEERTALNRLQARGTVRLALKDAGVDVKYASRYEIMRVFEVLMVNKLQSQGLELAAAEEVCNAVILRLQQGVIGEKEAGPHAMFARLDRAMRSKSDT